MQAAVETNTENLSFAIVCSRLRQNLKYGISRCFAEIRAARAARLFFPIHPIKF